jgi:hypothetical protein
LFSFCDPKKPSDVRRARRSAGLLRLVDHWFAAHDPWAGHAADVVDFCRRHRDVLQALLASGGDAPHIAAFAPTLIPFKAKVAALRKDFLSLRRLYPRSNNAFGEALTFFMGLEPNELRRVKVAVGPAQDGVTLWMNSLMETVMNPGYALFLVDGATSFVSMFPGGSALVLGDDDPTQSLHQLRFVGRLLGKALQQGVTLPNAKFRTHIMKHLLRQPFSFADLVEAQPSVAAHVEKIRSADQVEPGLFFTATDESPFGETRTVELRSNGSFIAVTDENKEEYCALLAHYHLRGSTADQLDALRSGFLDVFPDPLPLTGPELVWLLSGFPTEGKSDVQSMDLDDGQKEFWYTVVEELPQEDRAWLQRILDKGAVLDTDESAETPKIVLGSPASITLPRAETKEAMLDYVMYILDEEKFTARFIP